MTDICRPTEFSTLVARRDQLLAAMIERFAARPASPFVLRQLETAMALFEVGLADGHAPRTAGLRLGAWLKIAIRQSPELFVGETDAPERLGQLRDDWCDVLGRTVSGDNVDFDRRCVARICVEGLGAAAEMLTPTARSPVRALFIGDCLLWDASLQLQIEARLHGFAVEPTIMAQRLGAELRGKLVQRNEGDFDIIFYSPFSFEFSNAYAFACAPSAALWAPLKSARLLDEALADVAITIETLAARFDCPIYVHNVSGVQQSRPNWRGAMKRLASRPGRRMVRDRLSAGLNRVIGTLNDPRDRHISRIDELALCGDARAESLGFIAYDAGEMHPTRLATQLAGGPYLRAARVAADLAGKKLVVCDLDNTLWDGVLGEGAVIQHHDRQEVLLRLKARGIVLAIASKNDPENVCWELATLGKEDFVAQKINWGPKSVNILAMAEQLNLKPPSFVFLDDRPDERAMAAEAMPGLVALDPNDPETWAILELWGETMPRSALEDRTRMYRERVEREDFLNSIAAQSVEIGESYRNLGLRLSLRHPSEQEMTRVVELINRTNQFMDANTDHRRIIIADVRDKFGEMGIVGVLVTEFGDPWRITHFVLSCRVFGFGIEDAMLNSVKRWSGGAARIHAELIKTPVNGPCQDVYERNGFSREGKIWSFSEAVSGVDPSWLSVEDRTSAGKNCLARAAE